jgi:hypothetical protein
MNVSYDDTELAIEADEKIRTFQADASKEAGIFHHLIHIKHCFIFFLSDTQFFKQRSGLFFCFCFSAVTISCSFFYRYFLFFFLIFS